MILNMYETEKGKETTTLKTYTTEDCTRKIVEQEKFYLTGIMYHSCGILMEYQFSSHEISVFDHFSWLLMNCLMKNES